MTVNFNEQQTQRPDDYFVLQAKSKLKPGQGWYYIRGCRNSANEMMDYIAPTKVSIEIGLLEWIIPNTQFNQALISQAYNDFKILKEGKEALIGSDVKIMPGMPIPKDVTKNIPEMEKGHKSFPGIPVDGVEIHDDEVPEGPGNVPENPPHRGAVVKGDTGETLATYPPDIDKQPDITDYFANPANPMKKKELKSKIVEKLTELRVKIPEGATLKNLQNMLKISSGG